MMAANLTHKQQTRLIELRNLCNLYGAIKLKALINHYYGTNWKNSPYMRKDHDNMIAYFEELLNLTANNQLTK